MADRYGLGRHDGASGKSACQRVRPPAPHASRLVLTTHRVSRSYHNCNITAYSSISLERDSTSLDVGGRAYLITPMLASTYLSSRPALMDPHTMPVPPPMVQKRSFDDQPEEFQVHAQDSIELDQASSGLEKTGQSTHIEAEQDGTSRHSSPAVSNTMSSLSSVTATPPPPSNIGLQVPTVSSGPAQKRRKLTPTEKLEQQRQKEARQKVRQEEREKRENEKLEKDQHRRRKKEEQEKKKRQQELEAIEKEKAKDQKRREREEEQKKKDEKRREKEESKRREDDEKAKRERVRKGHSSARTCDSTNSEKAQSRINSFFAKPTTPSKDPARTILASAAPVAPSQQLESQPKDTQGSLDQSSGATQQDTITEFERHFLPFAARSDTVVAPANHHSWDTAALDHIQKELEVSESNTGTAAKCTKLEHLLELAPPDLLPKPCILPSVSDLMEAIEGDSQRSFSPFSSPLQALRRVPMKHLEFAEDVRPPYVGTNTQIRTSKEIRQLARRPLSKVRNDLDYDYDSEAEWEEPEEGEDILSEGESDPDSEADDMEDFLDDEEGADGQRPKKGFLKVDMQPVSTGLCFENAEGKLEGSCKVDSLDLDDLRIEPLFTAIPGGHPQLDSASLFPINPFDYGIRDSVESKARDTKATFRVPLQHKASDMNSANMFILKPASPPGDSKKASKTLEGPELAVFKDYVNGSKLTKSGVLSVLKSHFPKTTNDCLKATLTLVATNLGKGRAGNQWVLKEP